MRIDTYAKHVCRRRRDGVISHSAERDKNSAFLTAPLLKKAGENFIMSEIFSVCAFLAPRLAFGADKNVQSRRISVSSPYNRTAETDFGERKSEYDKTQATRRADCLPSF